LNLRPSGRAIHLIVDPKMEPDLRAHIQKRIAGGDEDSAALKRLATVLVSGIAFHADHFRFVVSRACFDGIDNDGDGRTDLEDPQCVDAIDDSESE
jgi:hypothetical protein